MWWKRLLLVVLVAAMAALSLESCNTVAGMRKDIKTGWHKLTGP